MAARIGIKWCRELELGDEYSEGELSGIWMESYSELLPVRGTKRMS